MSYTDSGFDKRVRNLLAAFASLAPPPPPAPPTGMLLWLDGAGIAVADGAPIDTWPDASGNALDATAAGAQRPTLDATSVINNRPAAAFDASNTQFFDLPVGFDDFTPGTALYVVHSPIDEFAQALAMFGISDNLVSSAFSWIIDTSNDGAGVVALQPGFFVLATAAVQSYAPTIFESHIPAGAGGSLQASEILLNHVLIAAGNFPVPDNVARNLNFVGNDAIAGVARYRGVIAEVILYDRALTALERAEMDAYLLDKYAL